MRVGHAEWRRKDWQDKQPTEKLKTVLSYTIALPIGALLLFGPFVAVGNALIGGNGLLSVHFMDWIVLGVAMWTVVFITNTR